MDGIKGDDLALLEEELKLSDPVDSRLDQEAHEAYVVPDGFRGIQEAVVGPGRYYVNTLAVTPVVIPTTNQTVEWTAEQIKGSFDPFEVISKDGFTMQLEVRVVFRVKPDNAPFMVTKIGSIDRLIQNVMHPLIDSIFRNQASDRRRRNLPPPFRTAPRRRRRRSPLHPANRQGRSREGSLDGRSARRGLPRAGQRARPARRRPGNAESDWRKRRADYTGRDGDWRKWRWRGWRIGHAAVAESVS